MLNIAYVHAAHTPYVMEHYDHISLVSDHVSKTSNYMYLTHKYLLLYYCPIVCIIKYIIHFEDIGTVVVEICIVVSVYF